MNIVATVRQLVIGRLRWLIATGDERDAEILALRHQILVLQRQIERPRFADTDRTILAVLSTVFSRSRLGQVMLIVQPATVIGWHRRLVATPSGTDNPHYRVRRDRIDTTGVVTLRVAGQLLRHLTIDTTRDYQPTGAPKGPTRPKKKRPEPS